MVGSLLPSLGASRFSPLPSVSSINRKKKLIGNRHKSTSKQAIRGSVPWPDICQFQRILLCGGVTIYLLVCCNNKIKRSWFSLGRLQYQVGDVRQLVNRFYLVQKSYE